MDGYNLYSETNIKNETQHMQVIPTKNTFAVPYGSFSAGSSKFTGAYTTRDLLKIVLSLAE